MTAEGRHVVLVGLMATGKSTVGALLARRLGRPLIDSDHVIEAAHGRTVRQIFETDGEPAFRAMEKDALRDALDCDASTVIAAAGGVVLDADNRAALADDRVTVVWLRADPELLAERAVRGTHRPLLDDDPVGRMKQMAVDRDGLYAEVADVTIDVAGRTPAEVVDLIEAST